MAILKIDTDDDEEIPILEPKRTWWQKTVTFLSSYVGLFLLLSAYTCLGAYYFYWVESVNEQASYEAMLVQHSNISDSINFMASYLSDLHFDDNRKLDNCSLLTSDPFFVTSEQYSLACLPVSPATRNSTFCKCVQLFKKRYQDLSDYLLTNLVSQVVTAADQYSYSLNEFGNETTWTWRWTVPNALMFSMSTLTLIGYGNIAPTTATNQLICVIFVILGLPLMMVFLANIGEAMANALRYTYSRLCCRWCRVRRYASQMQPDDPAPVTLRHDVVGDELYMPTDTVAIPIVVILCTMTLYLVIGGLLFTFWEDWSFIESVYFCFITLTTVGFGDYVPGTSGDHFASKSSRDSKMVFTTVYCLLGLSLISMCISLLQEQVQAKAGWFAKEVGLSDGSQDDMYILTKHVGVMVTPANRMGRKPLK